LERDISFKQSWISYRSTRLKAKENHNLKKDHEGGQFRALKHYLDVLSHVLDQSFSAFEDRDYLTKRIHSKYSNQFGILSYLDIESEIKQDITKSSLTLCLRNLEKRVLNTEILSLLLKLFLLIALPILFMTTRNFSIQKNLSISA